MKKNDFYSEFVDSLRAGYTHSLTANLPDPDPVLRRTGRSIEAYREIRADAKVSACIEQRKSATLALQWGLLPADTQTSGEQDQARIDTLTQALKRLDMPRIISGILDACLWGYQPLEVMWETLAGLMLPRDVVAKPAEWFVFDASNNLKFKSLAHPLGEMLPERKFLLAQHGATYNNPYGQKILPLCFWPVTFKKGGWRWWVQYTEKYGSPLLVGKYPRGVDATEVDDLEDALQRLFSQAVAAIPNDTQLETIASDAAHGGQHKMLIDQCNAEIALAIVGQTLTTEIGDHGSYAAAQTHDAVRHDIADSDRRMVERCLQCLVDWVYDLNWHGAPVPSFAMWPEEDIDKALAERDHILTTSGIRFTKSYFQRAYGLQDDDFEIAEPSSGPGAEFAEPTIKRHITAVKSTVKRPLSLDKYDLDGKKFSEFGKALVAQAIGLLDSSTSFNDVSDQLMQLYPEIDTGELEECLARAFYIAHIEGRLQ